MKPTGVEKRLAALKEQFRMLVTQGQPNQRLADAIAELQRTADAKLASTKS